MSSPMQKTVASRSISSNSPWRMASRYVTSAIVRSPARGTLVGMYGAPNTLAIPENRHPGGIGVDPGEAIARLGLRRCLRDVGGGVDLGGDPRIDRGKLVW